MSNSNEKTYSGIFGNKVFLKSCRGKTVITIPPAKPKNTPSIAQLKARQNFHLASVYARNVLKNPDMLTAYSARAHDRLSAYTVAFTDFLLPPRVIEIDLQGYKGNAGEIIHVTALDNFGVKEVNVQLLDSDGKEVESGPCVLNAITGSYDYTTAQNAVTIHGLRVIARATDHPGHTGELAVLIE